MEHDIGTASSSLSQIIGDVPLQEILELTGTGQSLLGSIPGNHSVELVMTKGEIAENLRQYRKFTIAAFLSQVYAITGAAANQRRRFTRIPNSPQDDNTIQIRKYFPASAHAVQHPCPESADTLQCPESAYTLQCPESAHTIHCPESAHTLHCPESAHTLYCPESAHTLQNSCPEVRVGTVEIKSEGSLDADPIYQLYKSRAETCKMINKSCLKQAEAISLFSIVRAIVHWEVLRKPPAESLSINVSKMDEREHYGGRALLYNLNRIKSVLLTFDKRVSDEVFPALPPLRETWPDNSRMHQTERRVLQHMTSWPTVLRNVLEGSDPTVFTRFVRELNEKFETYYNAVRVLKPVDAKHLFQDMFQRIYVYKAIYGLMLQCFHLLCLEES